MAKKKTMSSSDIATVNKQIIKDFGDVVRTGNELFDDIKDRKLLPISPAIDYAIGGGIQEGSLVQLAGKPKSGESAKMKAKRKSFKARHQRNINKGKMSAAYWADKVKW